MKFTVDGSNLNTLKRKLRRCMPGKRDEALTLVTVDVTRARATFELRGGSASVPAKASRSSRAQIPFVIFRTIWAFPFPDDHTVVLQVRNGIFIVDGAKLESSSIATCEPIARRRPLDTTPPAIPAPGTQTKAEPLISAYHYLRAYGLERRLGTPEFYAQQQEVDALLSTASNLLKRLGLRREDLEKLLDDKIGSRPPD